MNDPDILTGAWLLLALLLLIGALSLYGVVCCVSQCLKLCKQLLKKG